MKESFESKFKHSKQATHRKHSTAMGMWSKLQQASKQVQAFASTLPASQFEQGQASKQAPQASKQLGALQASSVKQAHASKPSIAVERAD